MAGVSPISVTLKPIAGFCIKSTGLEDGVYSIPPSEQGPGSYIAAPKGIKVFINVCFDDNVPSPPEGSEEVIQRAMEGEEAAMDDREWFVPVVVSHAREDTDKAGKKSLVFDSVYHTSIKSRVLKDPQFKLFIIELAVQRIEAKSGLSLSRTIGTPNIRSKGTLLPRVVKIPPTIYPSGHPLRVPLEAQPISGAKKLIEEVASAPTITSTPKGILKNSTKAESTPPASIKLDPSLETPAWTWSRDDSGLQVKIQVPKLKRADIPTSALDLEPRRLLLNIPSLYSLDINLELSDGDIQATARTPLTAVNAAQTMALKRNPHELNVDDARAEWRVADGLLVVFA